MNYRIYLKDLNSNYLLKIFFIIILIELFLMGSGRILEIGPLTIRMIFYGISLFISVVFILYLKRVKRYVQWFVITFLTLTIFSVLIGLIHKADISYILEDLKPLSYFLMIIPFSLYINNYKTIELVLTLVKICGFVMAALFLSYIILVYFNYLDFEIMYRLLSTDSNEIMFRGSNNQEPGFFYKGFLYLNIAFIFFIFSNKKLDKLFAIIMLIAIFFTLTRGFLLAILIAFTLFFIININYKKYFYCLIVLVISALILIPIYISFIGERSVSDIDRIIQIAQVIERIDLMSFFIGHGFGVGVPIRKVHMEISYLEIFHKQGLFGLAFWFCIFIFIIYNYITNKNKNNIVKSFFTGSIFVFAQSLTNPYINNPIGLAFILISMISLYELKKIDLASLQ